MRTASGDIALPNRKSQALVAYLATVTHGRDTRERVAGLLWSEHEEVKARASLRQTIADLKRVLEATDPTLFTADRIGMRLDISRIGTDFQEITEALDAGTLPATLLEERRLAERFLEGLEDLDPSFRSWLMVQRPAAAGPPRQPARGPPRKRAGPAHPQTHRGGAAQPRTDP